MFNGSKIPVVLKKKKKGSSEFRIAIRSTATKLGLCEVIINFCCIWNELCSKSTFWCKFTC